MDDLLSQINEFSRKAQQDPGGVQQIRITKTVGTGSIFIAPVADFEQRARFRARGIKDPQEALVHPDDWKRIRELIPKIEADAPLISGIPVIVEGKDD